MALMRNGKLKNNSNCYSPLSLVDFHLNDDEDELGESKILPTLKLTLEVSTTPILSKCRCNVSLFTNLVSKSIGFSVPATLRISTSFRKTNS